MPASLRSYSTGTATTTDVSVALPAGTQTGDVLFAEYIAYGSGTPAAPAGWTAVDGYSLTGGAVRWFTHIVTDVSAEPSSYTFPRHGGYNLVVILALSGVDTSSLFAVTPTKATGGTTVTLPSQTPGKGGLLIAALGSAHTGSAPWSTSSSMVKLGDWIGLPHPAAAIFSESVSSGVATGTKEFTRSIASWNQAGILITFRDGPELASGTSAGTSTATGAAKLTAKLAGTSAGTSSAAANAKIGTRVQATGTSAGASSATAAATLALSLPATGTATGSSSAIASANIRVTTTGSAAGTSTSAANAATITDPLSAHRIRIHPLTVQRNRQIPIDASREQVPMPVQATHERQQHNLAIARTIESSPLATARTIEPSPLATARGKQRSGIAVAREKKE